MTFILSLVPMTSFAQIRSFQTARLMSTSGAGVASILTSEAAILNPASSAFFSGQSFSYQNYKSSLSNNSDLRSINLDSQSNSGLFLSDNSGPLKGGVAYIKQNDVGYERTKMTLHSSANLGKKSSLGLSYNYLLDKRPSNSPHRHDVNHQVHLGYTFILDQDMSLGVALHDITKTTPGEERMILGFQYVVAQRFTILGDWASESYKEIKGLYYWAAALQMNLFSDVFLRVGQFYDTFQKSKGNSWGLSWVGPKLGLEFSQKYSTYFRDSASFFSAEKTIDSSFSLLINF